MRPWLQTPVLSKTNKQTETKTDPLLPGAISVWSWGMITRLAVPPMFYKGKGSCFFNRRSPWSWSWIAFPKREQCSVDEIGHKPSRYICYESGRTKQNSTTNSFGVRQKLGRKIPREANTWRQKSPRLGSFCSVNIPILPSSCLQSPHTHTWHLLHYPSFLSLVAKDSATQAWLIFILSSL
jgi:hypothetical protein